MPFLSRLNYSKNTINTPQKFPLLAILFVLISKEYFMYDAEKIVVLAILLIVISVAMFYGSAFNESLESEYYNMEFFWYELYLQKAAVARDYWRLSFTFVDQEDINQSTLVRYNKRLDAFFEKNKKKYFLFLFFILKSRFLKDIIDYINLVYTVLLNYMNNFIYINK